MTSVLALIALTGSAFASAPSDSDLPGQLVNDTESHELQTVRNRCETRRCRPPVRSQVRPTVRTSSVRAGVSVRNGTVRAHVSTRPAATARPARPAAATHRPSTSVYRPQNRAHRPGERHSTVRRTASTYRPAPPPRSTTVNANVTVHTTHARPLAIPQHRTVRPVVRPRTYSYERPRRVYVRPTVTHNTYHYRPYHGVFVYGPRVRHHSHYRHNPNVEVVQDAHLPTRKVDRQGTWAVGVRSGSYLTGYDGSNPYGDFGLGLTGRYRPFEALGLEAAITHHDQTWEDNTERSQTIAQGSVMAFANPWGRISPYVLGGLTANARTINDGYRVDGGGMNHVEANDILWGPHAGVGVEFAFGKNVALDLEARYTGYLNTEADDPTIPGALQTTAGFLVHF